MSQEQLQSKTALKMLVLRNHDGKRNQPSIKADMYREFTKEVEYDMDQLKRFAFERLENDQLVFELPSGNNSFIKFSKCGIINMLDDKNRIFFSFFHLTIQEFLAAQPLQHLVDDMEHVESFLIDHIDNPKWHLVIQFVAGLVGDKMKDLEKGRNSSPIG